MTRSLRQLSAEEVAISGLAGLPFVAYLVALNIGTHPSDAEWIAADPILKILPPTLTLWAVPAVAVLVAACWTSAARPSRAALLRGGKFALGGALTGVVLVAGIRLALGAQWASFIPPEESAAPGFLLNMTAGFGEELLFRLLAMPLLFFALRRKLQPVTALLVAALLTGFAFAGLHEMGPAPFEGAYLVTRIAIPGFAMSLVWGLVHPAFIIVAHGVAHVLIPILFTGVPL